MCESLKKLYILKSRKIIILTIVLILTSLVIPFKYDERIELISNEISKIDKEINIHLHEFTRFKLMNIEYINLRSSYSILLTLDAYFETNNNSFLIYQYFDEYQDTLYRAAEKIATLAEIDDYEIELLKDMNNTELNSKVGEYTIIFVDDLNDLIDEKSDYSEEITKLRKWKYGLVSISSILQFIGIIMTVLEDKKAHTQ